MLSDAVDKANDTNKGDRTVAGTGNAGDDDTSSLLSSCLFGFSNSDRDVVAAPPSLQAGTPGGGAGAAETLGFTGPSFSGARILTSNRFSSNYTNGVGGGVLWVNHYKRKRAMELSLQAEVITTSEKSRLFGSIDWIIDIEAGLHTRRYSTPDCTFMGLYLKYGGDLNFLFWEYRNPVVSEIKDQQGRIIELDTIGSDGLFGVNGDIGFGWSFVQTKRVKISLELLLGGSLFWFKTFEAFRNDLFRADGFIKTGIEVLLRTDDR